MPGIRGSGICESTCPQRIVRKGIDVTMYMYMFIEWNRREYIIFINVIRIQPVQLMTCKIDRLNMNIS